MFMWIFIEKNIREQWIIYFSKDECCKIFLGKCFQTRLWIWRIDKSNQYEIEYYVSYKYLCWKVVYDDKKPIYYENRSSLIKNINKNFAKSQPMRNVVLN